MTGAVRLTDVVVQYQTGSDRIRALNSVSLDVAPGEYVTIVGANGAGKSTLANVIAGAILPSAGRVAIAGRDVTRKRDYQRAASVSRVFQDVNDGACAALTVAENMLLAHLRAHRRSPVRLAANRRRRSMLRDELAGLRVGLENKMDVPAGALSGGQRQLVSLLMAVTGQPQVLLLDEHTSALDPEMAHVVIERTDSVIRERGLTALMITHNMAHAAHYGDRVLIMMRGRVVADIQDGDRAALDADGLIKRFRLLAADDVTDTLLGA